MKKPAKTPAKNPVLPAHRKQFEQLLEYWQGVLGLADWRIALSDIPAKGGVMGEVAKFDLEQRTAKIRIGTDFSETEVNERSLSELALHEMLHIFMYEFKEFCRTNDNADDILSAEHRIINVLETILSNASPLGPRT